VAAIKSAGGDVDYDWVLRNGNYVPAGRRWPPRWLVDLIGVDVLGHVTAVYIQTKSPVPNGVITRVGRLTQLCQLSLRSPSVNDADLAHLDRLCNLINPASSAFPLSD
jgi:hypothetical protein